MGFGRRGEKGAEIRVDFAQDRTSQLCGVSMLCLDAHYRTAHGFCVLCELEWARTGYKFGARTWHGGPSIFLFFCSPHS